jgi:hypothetical protein
MSADRLLSAFRELVRAELPQLLYLGVWEYSVTSATSSTFSGRATSTSFPLPDLVDVAMRPGIAGATFTPAVGSLVLVTFANANPARPVVVAWDATVPTGTEIDSDGVVKLGESATRVELASGTTILSAGGEARHVVCYGDILAGPVSTGVPYTIALAVPGVTPVSKVKA